MATICVDTSNCAPTIVQDAAPVALSGRTYDLIVVDINGREHRIPNVPVEYRIEDLPARAFPRIPVRNVKS